MGIKEEDIKAYEDRYKNLLYDKMGEIISNQSKLIAQIGKMSQYVDINKNIPNIGITFNNKLVELSQIFKEAGISMFAVPNEKNDFVGSNMVGDAIIGDMISRVSKATQILSEYDSTISKVTNQKMERVKSLEKIGPIKKLFWRIRGFFVPSTVSNLTSYSEEEIGEINSYLSKYEEIDESLYKYNLKDDVVQSLVDFINNSQYHDFSIPGLLEEEIIPTLIKLGLEDAIHQLQEELSNSQKQPRSLENKSWELSPTQKLGIQISSEQVANESKTNMSNILVEEIEKEEK